MSRADALGAVQHLLACPVCGSAMSVAGATLACVRGHSYDVARQGHVNLLGRTAPGNADTAPMVAARDRVLASGLYEPIADAVADAAGAARTLVEVGAGTGYYISRALDQRPDGLGVATDVSPVAARHAARAHPRLAAVVADTWERLPFLDATVDALLCVFAPRNAGEFARVLAPRGRVVIVVPRATHLAELRQRLGLLDVAAGKATALAEAFAPALAVVATRRVTFSRNLRSGEVADLVAMGPNAFHAQRPGDPVDAAVTVDVDVVTLQASGPQASETRSE